MKKPLPHHTNTDGTRAGLIWFSMGIPAIPLSLTLPDSSAGQHPFLCLSLYDKPLTATERLLHVAYDLIIKRVVRRNDDRWHLAVYEGYRTMPHFKSLDNLFMVFLCHAAYPVKGQSVTNDLKFLDAFDRPNLGYSRVNSESGMNMPTIGNGTTWHLRTHRSRSPKMFRMKYADFSKAIQ